jgi:phosphoglycerate dehydrogenase-like enzyme
VNRPRIAIGPRSEDFAIDAVRLGGGDPVKLGSDADALVWLSSSDVDGLRAALEDQPDIRWVQLPFAGVENVVGSGLIDADRIWSCAKGSYARPVAEHALLLALAGLRMLHERVRAHTWGSPAGTSLFGADVVVLGGGGIARELLRLLEPFEVRTTIVRRSREPVPGAGATIELSALDRVLPEALVVFVALALTPETRRVVGREQLRAMSDRAWLVNVARGAHVDTEALVGALRSGEIGGAALDVTDPEPLPGGHPLWSAPNCIITPHTADTWEMVLPLLADRIRHNVVRFVAGSALAGVIDPVAGY